MAENLDLSQREKEALNFLDRDFNQCFQQMRHYDGQIFEICKFGFLGYTSLTGTALAAYQFGLKEGHSFQIAIITTLSIATVFGFFLFALGVRNRVYFVQVARYINEQRKLFLAIKPLGFSNQSRLYTDPTQPPFFNWRSSQACFLYLIGSLNGVLVAVLAFVVSPLGTEICRAICSGLCVTVFQLVCGISYLKSRERKSAEAAVFGKATSSPNV